MAPEDFYENIQPEPTKVQMYAINMLSERQPDLNVRFEVDQDYETDQEYRANKALMLRKMGLYSGLDTLRALDVPNADEVKDNADAENSVLEMAKEIAANPQLMQTVQAAMAGQLAAGPVPAEKPQPKGKAA
jgi:hypothetical protein